ncbi:hypothetical protein ACFL1I_03855 [Candidatus Omnitrophota bacterium]
MLSRRLKNLFKLILINCLILFILGETICRAIPILRVKNFPKHLYRPDEKLGCVLVPNAKAQYSSRCYSINIEINSLGLRDREFSLEKGPGVSRILVLGDSMTFGSCVDNDQTYPKYLEKLLNMNAVDNQKYEVINAGVFAWGLNQEYNYLKSQGIRLNPDLIIVGVYTNDVEDAYRAKVNSALPLSPRFPFKKFVAEYSYFYKFLRVYYDIALLKLGLRFPAAMFTSPADILNQNCPERLQLTFDQAKQEMLKIRDLARENNARIIFAVLPGVPTVLAELNSGQSAAVKKTRWFNQAFMELYYLKVHQEILKRLRADQIPVIDPLPRFAQVCQVHSWEYLYFWCDQHFTPEGNRLAAEVIYDFILTEGFIN